ncbi:hypothetical protein J6590_003467 [Homalodisca vitripennis]|nr:hypothetical protein J6590_003467 [Homalodisca vitripennis]
MSDCKARRSIVRSNGQKLDASYNRRFFGLNYTTFFPASHFIMSENVMAPSAVLKLRSLMLPFSPVVNIDIFVPASYGKNDLAYDIEKDFRCFQAIFRRYRISILPAKYHPLSIKTVMEILAQRLRQVDIIVALPTLWKPLCHHEGSMNKISPAALDVKITMALTFQFHQTFVSGADVCDVHQVGGTRVSACPAIFESRLKYELKYPVYTRSIDVNLNFGVAKFVANL